MLDKSNSGRPYVLFVPIIEGSFRASLQPGQDDNVDVCVESGSSKVTEASYDSVVYMHSGDNPFELVKEAMKVVRSHLGTFNLLEEKTPPGIVDKFGWCTWDAFYLTVHPQGIWEGVKGLVEGNVRFKHSINYMDDELITNISVHLILYNKIMRGILISLYDINSIHFLSAL